MALFAHDLEIDVLGHSPGEAVSAAQCRATAEHEAEVAGVDGGNRRQRFDDVPILLDQRRPRQAEMLLDFQQLFEGGPIAQPQAPHFGIEMAREAALHPYDGLTGTCVERPSL